MVNSRILILIWPLYFSAACSAWIDDFDIAETDGTETMDSSSGSDSSTENTGTGSDMDPRPIEVFCDDFQTSPDRVTVSMCDVDGGRFKMGCDNTFVDDEKCLPDEMPAHLVEVSDFSIMRFEVTQDQYAAFINAEPHWAKGGADALSACNYNYLSSWTNSVPPAGQGAFPVVEVCWEAARAFCAWLGDGLDLPSEAQWERAARGKSDGLSSAYHMYPSGNSMNCALANYDGCSGRLQAVGTTDGTSPFGIYDMSGNAWEWTLDVYSASYYCDPQQTGMYEYPHCDTTVETVDPVSTGESAQRSLRGGAWFHPADMMRTAKRSWMEHSTSSNLVGFRCAE